MGDRGKSKNAEIFNAVSTLYNNVKTRFFLYGLGDRPQYIFYKILGSFCKIFWENPNVRGEHPSVRGARQRRGTNQNLVDIPQYACQTNRNEILRRFDVNV